MKFDASDFIITSGFLMFLVGAWMISPPVSLLISGAVLMVLGFVITTPRKGGDNK